MRLALPLTLTGVILVVVECQQSIDNRTNFFDVLSSQPALNRTYQSLRWHSRGEFLQQLASLQNVTFLAPAYDAWNRFNNFRDDFQDSSLVDVNDLEGSRTLRERTWLYHFLIGSFEHFLSDRVLPTNLAPPDWTRVTSGAVVKYTHDDNSFLSGMGHISRISSSSGNLDVPQHPISFGSGQIYVVDDFLHIPQNLSATIAAVNDTSSVTLFKDFGLVAHSEAPIYTVLVPSNGAWLKQKDSIDRLSPSQIEGVAKAHIIPGVRYSTNLQPEIAWTTLYGNTLTLSGANFTTLNQTFTLGSGSDTPLWIGVMHIIDKVLNPFNLTRQEDVADAEPGSGHGPGSDSGPDTSPSSGTHSDSGLSTGAKIGIGVAVPLGVLAIAALSFFIYRKRKHEQRVAPPTTVAEMGSHERRELAGGPYDPANRGPAQQMPELEAHATNLAPRPRELANDTTQRTASHELASTSHHATTTGAASQTSTATPGEKKPFSLSVAPATLSTHPEPLAAESYNELTEEADTLVAELGVIQKRKRTLAAAANSAGVMEPGDVAGRKGEEYRKLVGREQDVRERMEEVQRALRIGGTGR